LEDARVNTTTTKTRFPDSAATQQELVAKLQLVAILGGTYELTVGAGPGVIEFKVILPDAQVEFYSRARKLPVW
jgi:hypothetical protein